MQRRPDPDRVAELFLNFWIARAVMAAVELDVFDLLAGNSLTVDEVRARLGMAERPVRGLLDTCVSVGLLERAEGGYRTTEEGRVYLTRDSEYSLRNYVLDESWCWPMWGRLTESMRTNTQALPPDDSGYHAFPEEFFLDFLHGHSLAMGERLADVVDLAGTARVMDVGGGSGAVSIALCRANPTLRSVVVDRAEVLRKTAEHVARAGLDDRIDTHPANFFTDPLPEGCDGAILANVLHDFSPEKARRIISRVAEALPSGATLVIMEIAPNDDRTGPPLAVVFTLTMLVNTEGGEAHTAAQYRAWLDEAGFDVERVSPLGGKLVTTAIEARKRSEEARGMRASRTEP